MGCGAGKSAVMALAALPEEATLTCADISTVMIDFAKKKLSGIIVAFVT